jgi:DNA-binding CsgD family transcriptional regulator
MPKTQLRAPLFAAGKGKLSAKSQQILEMLSSGMPEISILGQDDRITRRDLVDAAREALILNDAAVVRTARVAKMLKHYPRAYEKWCPDEEVRVIELYSAGKTLREIAAVVKRQPQAVKLRLQRLGAFRD